MRMVVSIHSVRSHTLVNHTLANIVLLLFFLLWPVLSVADEIEQSITLSLSEDTELPITRFPASGRELLIWIPSVAIPTDDIHEISIALQQTGIEIWYADFFTAYFLSKVPSSAYKIPGKDIKTLLSFAMQQNPGKTVFMLGSSRTVIPIFQGMQLWQHDPGPGRFGGVILNSPFFFQETPDPGRDAQLFPIVSRTNLPIYILQPVLSPRAWQLRSVLPVLENSGSDVFVHALKNVRGRFHFRPDATAIERQTTQQLPRLMRQAFKLLNAVNNKARIPLPVTVQQTEIAEGKKDRKLTRYRGDSTPPTLKLKNLDGQWVDLASLKGNVVLVNFWTTWCPPCVHEMPSMQRLSNHMHNKPFYLLGVNMAEDRNTINTFLRNKVNISFPILLDSDGKTLLDWKVNAFPTSFIIDKHGKIRYALFGSIEWDTPEVINTIQRLLDEPVPFN